MDYQFQKEENDLLNKPHPQLTDDQRKILFGGHMKCTFCNKSFKIADLTKDIVKLKGKNKTKTHDVYYCQACAAVDASVKIKVRGFGTYPIGLK